MSPRPGVGIGFIFILIILNGCAAHSPQYYSFPDNRQIPYGTVRAMVVENALSLLGAPYQLGGDTPRGFDCSGFVKYVYRQALGMTLPRETRHQVREGNAVHPQRLLPADLLFFKIERQKSLHVGIYLGDGKFIHAPSSGGHVNVQELTADYWKDRYLVAKRLL